MPGPTLTAIVQRYVRELATQLGPGSPLPAERELAAACGVSRVTVRHALAELAKHRVVERRHGAGTFVSRTATAQPLLATSFHDDMRRRGLRPSSRLLDDDVVAADVSLARRLRIAKGEDVLVVRRLRLAGGEPMALETLSVPLRRTPGLVASDLTEVSFYAILRKRFGRRVSSGRQRVTPVVLTEPDAELLDVHTGSPAWRFERTSLDQDYEIVAHSDAIYRADRYEIEVDVLPFTDG